MSTTAVSSALTTTPSKALSSKQSSSDTTTNGTKGIQQSQQQVIDSILASFYGKILAWDLSYLKPNEKSLKDVKVTYTNKDDYLGIFSNLLLEECRAQLERSIQEGDSKEEVQPCLGRVRYLSDNNDYLEVGLVLKNENDMFMFHENDLMMISFHHPMIIFGGNEDEEMTDSEDEDDNEKVPDKSSTSESIEKTKLKQQQESEANSTAEDASGKKKKKVIPPSSVPITDENRNLHLVGTVENFKAGGIKVKFCLKNIKDDRGHQMNILLRYEKDWWITKLCNLSTIQREYLALYLTSTTPFMDILLLKDHENLEKGLEMKIPPSLENKFKDTYNSSQFGAMKAALDGSQITLIQGPPGTGKTHVICGLISVLLHSREVPKIAQNDTKDLSKFDELMEFEKEDYWDISQPWYKNEKKDFTHIRDNFELIDYTFEEKEEKRKRDLWRKLRETGSILEKKRKKRILLCAPSNGAVDEIVSRLVNDGIWNGDAKKYHPNIVRVGPGSHIDVEKVSLEYLVRSRQQLMNSNTAIPSSSASTATATTSIKSNMDTSSVGALILNDADIVATTLSFSGSSLLTKMNGFDIVIIDEAAQAVETSTLVPIQHKCKKIILVGDPKQLPATIISPIAIKYKYDQSLFQRLQEKCPPVMLTTQYRMHSKIRTFPSQHFYNDLLEDGPNIPSRQMNYHENPFFGPMVFYDLQYSRESKPGGGSVMNQDEVQMVFYLYQLILKQYPQEDFSGRVGIISPYRQQVLALREAFKNYSGISIDTVDGYQGREREIIIFSCVRAPLINNMTPTNSSNTIGNLDDLSSIHSTSSSSSNNNNNHTDNEIPPNIGGIGFLADVRRMNVALTRPRSSLLIVGNSLSLSRNNDWNQLIKHAQLNNCLIPVKLEAKGPNELKPSVGHVLLTFTGEEKFRELAEIGSKQKIFDPLVEEDEANIRKQKNNNKKKRHHKKSTKKNQTDSDTTTTKQPEKRFKSKHNKEASDNPVTS